MSAMLSVVSTSFLSALPTSSNSFHSLPFLGVCGSIPCSKDVDEPVVFETSKKLAFLSKFFFYLKRANIEFPAQTY